MIEIKKLNLKYKKQIFNNLNLKIKPNKLNIILMNNAKGKTTLSHLLKGKIKYDYIYLNNTPYKNLTKEYKQNKIKLIDDTPFQTNNPLYELSKDQELNNIPPKQIQLNILNISMKLNMVEILNIPFIDLTDESKIKVKLAKALITDPDVIILDDPLTNLYNKKEIIKLLKQTKKTIIYITSNSEDLIYADYIYIIDKKVKQEGTKQEILKDEQTFTKNKIQEPVMLELSTKLKYYNLIDKIYYSETKLIEDLWK